MARRPQPTRTALIQDTSAQVKATPGILYSLYIAATGVAVGDRVTIYDNTVSGGTKLEEIFFSSSTFNQAIPMPAIGKGFNTGLYVNISAAGGSEVTVSIGYD